MAEGVTRLKELLLDKEQRALGDLSNRIDVVFERAGTSERLRQSVAEVLADAFREAEVAAEGHADLAAAVSPVIIDTVRREVRASADELAESLHPHMGRMISAYVASAIKDLMAKMNRRLESGLSPHRWVIKIRSMLTGTSEAELLLADMNVLRVQELYLIRRGSGDLISHWEAVGAGEVGGTPVEGVPSSAGGASNRDAVVSAFLTAINDFAREAFAATDGGLQTLDMQSHRVYLRSSPMYLLAAKCSGLPTPQTERMLDQEFAAAIEKHRNFLSTKLNGHQPSEVRTLLPDLAVRMQSGIDTGSELGNASRPNLAKWLLILLAAGIVGWLAWDKWLTWQTERTRAAVDTVLTGSVMGSYVSGVEVEPGGALVRLRGLSPSEADKESLLQAMRRALAGTRIEDRIEVIPDRGDSGLKSLKRDVLETTAGAALSATRRAVQRARYRIDQVVGEAARIGRDNEDPAARSVLETTAKRVTAAGSELAESAKELSQAGIGDDLGKLTPRLDAILAMLGKSANDLSILRGDKPAPDLVRLPHGSESNAHTRETAELLAAAADGLWTEMALTERHMLRRALAQLAKRPTTSVTPRQELVQWAQAHAIFFSAESTFRDAAESNQLLDEVAALLKRTEGVVRVVGYTDDLGTSSRNSSVSTDRATKVRQALVDRGIASQRLVAIGRANGPNVSPNTGLNSPNRRVEFEIGFERE